MSEQYEISAALQAVLDRIADEPGTEIGFREDGFPVVYMNGARASDALPHFRSRIDAAWYLAEQPTSRDIVCARIAQRAARRREFPTWPWEIPFLQANDLPLCELLTDVANRYAWHDLHEAKVQAPALTAYDLPASVKVQRDLGIESLLRWTHALPALRGLGELIIEEKLAAEMEPTDENDARTEGGSGGRKNKPRASAGQRDDFNPDRPPGLDDGLDYDLPAPFGP